MKNFLLSITILSCIACGGQRMYYYGNNTTLTIDQVDSLQSTFIGFKSFKDSVLKSVDEFTIGILNEDAVYEVDTDLGKFPRDIVYRNTQLVLEHMANGKNNNATFKFCADRAGNINYLKLLTDRKDTNMTDQKIYRLMHALSTYKISVDSLAPEQHCSNYTFNIDR